MLILYSPCPLVVILEFGLLTCSNPLLWEFSYLTFLLLLGLVGTPGKFWTWPANCLKCGIVRKGTNGLFCSNFGAYRGGHFEVCWRVWCRSCYTPHPLDRFHVNTPKDEDGFEWLSKPNDTFRYKQARNGDHLITPFQCEWCLFRLLTGTIPNLT
jgi:hypothetical protein